MLWKQLVESRVRNRPPQCRARTPQPHSYRIGPVRQTGSSYGRLRLMPSDQRPAKQPELDAVSSSNVEPQVASAILQPALDAEQYRERRLARVARPNLDREVDVNSHERILWSSDAALARAVDADSQDQGLSIEGGRKCAPFLVRQM